MMDHNAFRQKDPSVSDFHQQSLGYILINQDANYHLAANSKFIVYFCSPEFESSFKKHFYHLTASYFDDRLIADGGNLNSLTVTERASNLLNLAYAKDIKPVFPPEHIF